MVGYVFACLKIISNSSSPLPLLECFIAVVKSPPVSRETHEKVGRGLGFGECEMNTEVQRGHTASR